MPNSPEKIEHKAYKKTKKPWNCRTGPQGAQPAISRTKTAGRLYRGLINDPLIRLGDEPQETCITKTAKLFLISLRNSQQYTPRNALHIATHDADAARMSHRTIQIKDAKSTKTQ